MTDARSLAALALCVDALDELMGDTDCDDDPPSLPMRACQAAAAILQEHSNPSGTPVRGACRATAPSALPKVALDRRLRATVRPKTPSTPTP